MGEVKNLASSEAVEKLRELAEGIDVCMFCTQLSLHPIPTRPMSVQEVDEEGNIWFMSSSESHKNFEIKQDEKVQLFFSKMSDAHFLTVYGQADILVDRKKIEEMWDGFVKAWFTEGKDDPRITLIRVRPLHAYYWDTKDGKMISLIKVAASAITGKTNDGGIEGKLNV